MGHKPANPTTSDRITFTAVVKNQGNAKAGPSTLALWVGGETNPATFAVPALTPGATFSVERREVLNVAQNYRNTAMADYKKVVAESNENNNKRTHDYTVTQPAQP